MPEKPNKTSKPFVIINPFFIHWKNLIIPLLIGTTLIGAGLVGYYYFQLKWLAPPLPITFPKKATPSANPATSSAQKDETAGWKTYASSYILFSYPENLSVNEFEHTDSYSPYYTISSKNCPVQDTLCVRDGVMTIGIGPKLSDGWSVGTYTEVSVKTQSLFGECISVKGTEQKTTLDSKEAIKRTYVFTANQIANEPCLKENNRLNTFRQNTDYEIVGYVTKNTNNIVVVELSYSKGEYGKAEVLSKILQNLRLK